MYELIQHQKLESAASSITFSSIPQIYTDLMLVVSARTNRATQVDDQLKMTFNGSSSGYSERGLGGNGSGTFSFTGAVSTSIPDALWTTASGATSSAFGNSAAYIPKYTSSVAKSVFSDSSTENNGTSASNAIISGLWTGTDPINSIVLSPLNGTLIAQNSSATLYGINRTSALGRPKAIGGNITYANGYWVHTFTGSGTFYAQDDLSLEYLVLAGGGGGARDQAVGAGGSGGGAGGYRASIAGELSGANSAAEPRLLVSRGQGIPVAVGAGGAGATANRTYGLSGSDSALGSIISIGGGGGAPYGGTGRIGGSGGGGYLSGHQGAGTALQGFAGSFGANGSGSSGGGGGGAGSAAVNSSQTVKGDGGNGLSSSITGTAVIRAGGGGGGRYANETGGPGAGGTGGGGAGGSNGPGVSATAGTGSGGGGGAAQSSGGSSFDGGSGGSGVVIVRYRAD